MMPRACAASSALGDPDAPFEQQIERQRLAFDTVLQRRAFQELHGDKRLALMIADLINGADVRVVERRRSARLAPQPFQRRSIPSQFRWKEFQSNEAAEVQILCLVDNAHPAAAQFFQDAVVRNRFADQ